MGSEFDEMKGRAKEAAGDLTQDEDLKREGKTDQLGADIKEKAEAAKDKVDDTVDKVKEKLDRDR
ncbi:MAG: CsbD family protein [Actinomycetota bacterium]|nr:CsbD family protein [Actinomycetota bacterium]